MTGEKPGPTTDPAGPTSTRSRSTPLLERRDLTPAQRARVGLAASGLLGVGLISIVALVALVVWHLVRRGRLIRDRLGPPRNIRLPETEPSNRTRPERLAPHDRPEVPPG